MNQHQASGGQNGVVPQVIALKMSHKSIKNYSYLVVELSRRLGVIVDPVWEMEKIKQALIEAQARLSGILITHSHPDHINLAEPLAVKHDCTIWMSTEEIEFSGFDARHLVAIDVNPRRVGEMLIEPILTPGHTPGCICYLIGDDLFSGDVLFAEGCGVCPNTRAVHTNVCQLAEFETSRQASNPRLSRAFLRETAWAAHVTAAPRKYLYEFF